MIMRIISPYVVALSHDLIHVLGAKPDDEICFAAIKDDQDKILSVWIGVSTIFSHQDHLTYTLKDRHYGGLPGFSAKQLVYDLNLNPGVYRVSPVVRYCKHTGIDWREIQITEFQKRNWRLISLNKNPKKKSRKNLESSGESPIFVGEDCSSL